MRIGTWNMAGRMTLEHVTVLGRHDVDIWLLTEVARDLDAAYLGYDVVSCSEVPMQEGKHFAAVLSRVWGSALPSPHGATAAARVAELDVWCSVLPWRSASGDPWSGEGQSGKVEAALAVLGARATGPQVWGGDWNQELEGPVVAGCAAGRTGVEELLARWSLDVPTRALLHQRGGASIDHVAVRTPPMTVRSETRVRAGGLSDHDAYVVEVEL